MAFRSHTLLPLDDCLYALQADDPPSYTVVAASLFSASRCFATATDGDETAVRLKFKSYPIGYFHIDIAEVRTAQGKLYLLVAIDRTSKFTFVELHEKATPRVAAHFLHGAC